MPPPELVSAGRASADAVVEKGRAEVWRTALACLARRFFVDRADAASGTVALSYAGDPAPYVDGARLASGGASSAPGGPRIASLAPAGPSGEEGAAAGAEVVTRVIQLEARVDVVLEPIERSATSISARARYTVTRMLTPDWQGRSLRPDLATVSFGSGQPGSVPDASNRMFEGSGPEVFWPTGRLEAEVLSCFR